MEVIVIDCTHAGTAAILNIRKSYPDAQISLYEINDTISFLSCGIALYVGGVVKDRQGLFYCTPEKLAEIGVKTKMKHDVIDLDIYNKKVMVKNLMTNEVEEDNYDKLVITSGSWPIVPQIQGIEPENVLLSKDFYHSNEIGKVSKVVTTKGEYLADLVILCIGFKPNTELFRGKLDMLNNGAIIIDECVF